MGRIKIVSDSTCDLTEDLLKKYDISIIPLNIVLDTKSYIDGKEITPEDIYSWADKMNTTPKTAGPEMGYILDFLRPYAQAGEDMIFIGISEDMSVTCNSVRMAASDLSYSKIRVINSKNLSAGVGLQVIRAAEYAAQGKDADWIVNQIEAARDKVYSSFVIDTLTYLQRGGRCSAVTALLGNVLKLKPMISVKEGKMGVEKKYRGKQQLVVRSYAKDMEPLLLTADPTRVFIAHSGIDPVIEKETYDYLKSLNYFKEIYITRAGGVISSHCGPNTLGILFYEN